MRIEANSRVQAKTQALSKAKFSPEFSPVDGLPVSVIRPRGRRLRTDTPLALAITQRGYRIMAEFAHATGCAERTITFYLAGDRPIPPARLVIFARVLKISDPNLLQHPKWKTFRSA